MRANQIAALLLVFLFAFFAMMWLSGCAGTTVRDPQSGRVVFHTQANAATLDFTSGMPGLALHMTQLNHAIATRAGGHAFAEGTNSVGLAGTAWLSTMTVPGASAATTTARAALPTIGNVIGQSKPAPAAQ